MAPINKNKIIITIFLIILLYAILVIFSDIEEILEIYQDIELFYLVPILLLTIFSTFLFAGGLNAVSFPSIFSR